MKSEELRRLIVEQLRANKSILWQDYTWGGGTSQIAVRTLKGTAPSVGGERHYYMTLYDDGEVVLSTRSAKEDKRQAVASSKHWCSVDMLWLEAMAKADQDDAATR